MIDLEIYDVSAGFVTWLIPHTRRGRQWIAQNVDPSRARYDIEYDPRNADRPGVAKRYLSSLRPKMTDLRVKTYA
jgi:hypothetical protein